MLERPKEVDEQIVPDEKDVEQKSLPPSDQGEGQTTSDGSQPDITMPRTPKPNGLSPFGVLKALFTSSRGLAAPSLSASSVLILGSLYTTYVLSLYQPRYTARC